MSDEEQTTARSIDEALGAIEAVHAVVSLVDSIKTGLEAAGWGQSPASQAATVLGNTMLMAGALNRHVPS